MKDMTFKSGDRVELHPALDAWMAGDRFGTVDRVTVSRRFSGRVTVHIRMDRSGRVRRIGEDALTLVSS